MLHTNILRTTSGKSGFDTGCTVGLLINKRHHFASVVIIIDILCTFVQYYVFGLRNIYENNNMTSWRNLNIIQICTLNVHSHLALMEPDSPISKRHRISAWYTWVIAAECIRVFDDRKVTRYRASTGKNFWIIQYHQYHLSSCQLMGLHS